MSREDPDYGDPPDGVNKLVRSLWELSPDVRAEVSQAGGNLRIFLLPFCGFSGRNFVVVFESVESVYERFRA